MNFSKLKIGTRLALDFALVILAGLIVAVFGTVQFQNVDKKVSKLIDDRMVKVAQLSKVKDNLNLIARHISDLPLAKDREEMQSESLSIENAQAENSELLKKIDATMKLEKSRALIQKVQDVRAPFNASVDKATTLVFANRNDEARVILHDEMAPLQAAYIQNLDDLIAYQKSLMQDSAQEILDISRSTSITMLIVAALAAVAGCVVAWILTRSITSQLGGEPAYASIVAREIAEGNLAVDVRVRSGDQSSLLANMKNMRDSLGDVVNRVRQGSESLAAASTQIADGNNDLSGRTEKQASALEETAASMEELGSTVKQNADNAAQANRLAQTAFDVASKGGEIVAQVVDTMNSITDSSKKISDIISVIDGIAFQTNILALNAAVEAARAGDQGRGFAVVASEVRSLAQRSAQAAKEIKTLITESVERVEHGSILVNQAGATMGDIVTSIQRVTTLMGEISTASSEQSAGVAQVGEAVVQMDQTTQQNAALVEEMAAAAGSLNHQAQDLVQAVAVFKLMDSTGGSHLQTMHRPHTSANEPVGHGNTASQRAVPHRAATAPRIANAKSPALQPAYAGQKTRTGTDDWDSF